MNINPEFEEEVRRLLNIGQRKQAILYLQKVLSVSQENSEKLVLAVENELLTESQQRQQILQRVGGTFSGCGGLVFKMVSFGFGFFALSLIAMAVVVYLLTNNFVPDAVHVDGEVVELTKDSGESFAPVIEYLWNDQTKKIKGKIHSSPPKYELGQTVSVLVNPENPDEVLIDSFEERWFISTVIGGFGAFFLLLTITFYVIGKKISKPL